MRKFSASGSGMAQELSEVQSVNGLHQDVESQSTRCPNGASLDHAHTPTRLTRTGAFSGIVRASRAMDEVCAKIERMRGSEAPMLITGETGTGKELIARAAYGLSPRHKGEFIPFNCGGLTPELIASELFGYRRGAFTGADRDYIGVIRAADGGTLFLDEIGELLLAGQSKLLRFLQEGEVHPLGETRPTKVKVRVIAATNRDLEADVRSGRFRDDLYWRLNGFHVPILPLRKRREDIRPLTEHFLDLRQRQAGKQGLRLSDEAWALMLGHQWPGNVRELVAVANRLAAFAENGEMIGRESALDAIQAGICSPPAAAIVEDGILINRRQPYREARDKLLRAQIEFALNETGSNLSQAATMLEMSIHGLKKAIKRLGIR
ncbi:MAG: sigma 54-interacting transcriptional regulator [Blastocatellia bacterium]